MDILLIIYSVIFVAILGFPSAFLFVRFKKNSVFGEAVAEDYLNLLEEKQILLSNLGDLKAEDETGKLKTGEFRELSQGLLHDLDAIDSKISESKKSIAMKEKTPSNVTPVVIQFCPKCGTKTLPEASFCHSCGAKLEEIRMGG
jgi:hypothetical protein